MKGGNPYAPVSATIDRIVDETPAIKTFVLTPREQIPFTTGQFVEVNVPGAGESPFTPSSSPLVRDHMDVTVMKTGRITALLHQMRGGDTLGLRGPYGKGYPVQEMVGKQVLIVGGGCGLAPLKSLVLALFARQEDFERILLRYGAKTPADIMYKRELEEWAQKIDVALTVDVGDESWKGNVGVVTTLLDKTEVPVQKTVAVVCGPPVMMKFATRKLLDMGFGPPGIYLSMEKNMSCGIGKCGHCRLGPYYVCRDGPVFRYDTIKDIPGIWE